MFLRRLLEARVKLGVNAARAKVHNLVKLKYVLPTHAFRKLPRLPHPTEEEDEQHEEGETYYPYPS